MNDLSALKTNGNFNLWHKWWQIHALHGYLQKPWNVHASLLLFLYPDSIWALFVYSVTVRVRKSWSTERYRAASHQQIFYHFSPEGTWHSTVAMILMFFFHTCADSLFWFLWSTSSVMVFPRLFGEGWTHIQRISSPVQWLRFKRWSGLLVHQILASKSSAPIPPMSCG